MWIKYLLLVSIFISRCNDNVHFVILAGGKGERLWPLSRELHPKQFLPLTENKSLLELSIDRIAPLASKENIHTISIQEQEKLIEDTVGHMIGHQFIEPSSRNTAPAILYTCLEIAAIDPNAIIVFLPADHYIPDHESFRQTLIQAIQYSNDHDIITLIGIKPKWIATGYGYIEFKPTHSMNIFEVSKFHEKPVLSIAQGYIQQDNMLWNAGMFCAPASRFIKDFQQHAPLLYASMIKFLNHEISYNDLPNISVDYAIIEKTKTSVIPGDFEWSDVGNLDTYLTIMQSTSPRKTNVIEVDSSNNLYETKKITAVLGLHDICIIETDDIILVASRQEIENVKKILNVIKNNNTLTSYKKLSLNNENQESSHQRIILIN